MEKTFLELYADSKALAVDHPKKALFIFGAGVLFGALIF